MIGAPESPSPKHKAFMSLSCSPAIRSVASVLPQTPMLVCASEVSVPIWDVFGCFINLVKILLLLLGNMYLLLSSESRDTNSATPLQDKYPQRNFCTYVPTYTYRNNPNTHYRVTKLK